MALHEAAKRAKKRDPKKIAIVIALVIAILAGIGGGVYALLNSSLFDKGAEIDMSKYGSPVEVSEKSVNFLVVGADQDEDKGGNYLGRYLTDVIMVVSFDMEAGKVNLLQIPRDTYVGTKYPSAKINAVYNNGPHDEKILNLIERINEDYQLPIDHYVMVTMKTFRDAIDAIGGIEMNVPWDIRVANEGLYVKKGLQTLTGQQAEAFVRCREIYAEGDIGRVKAQRVFLSAALDKITKLSANELIKLISMSYSQVNTDLTAADILTYAQKVSKINLEDMEMYMVPGESARSAEGLSIWSVHKKEVADLLNEKFRPYTDDVPASELKCIEVSNRYGYYNENGNTAQDIIDGAKPGTDTINKK